MMQSEFENLIGYEITLEEYEKVETVYMAWDYKEMSKAKIADLYKKDKEFVIDTLYSYIVNQNGRYKARVDECQDLRELLFITETSKNACDKLVSTMEKYIHGLEERNEELETQLHQYQAYFAEINKNITLDLYKTLFGVAR